MFKIMSNEDKISVMTSFMEGERIEQMALSGRGKWRFVALPSWNFHKNLYRVIDDVKYESIEIVDNIPIDERIEIANENMKEAIKIHSDLVLIRKAVEKDKLKNNNISEIAKGYLGGHSRDKLKERLTDYFVFQEGKSIAGKVLVKDIEGLLSDETAIDTIIINVGGEAIWNFLSFTGSKKIIEGELMIEVNKKGKRMHEKNKKLFNRRMRRKPVVEKLLEYGEKLDLGFNKEGVE